LSHSVSIESVLKRDRTVVLAGLVSISALAWGYMVHESRAMVHTGVCQCAGMKMSGPDMQSWSASTLVPLFLMWAEMMVAMMIPSAAPMILTFATVNRKRREQEGPFVPTGIFLLGYLVVWTLFSAFAAVAQWILHSSALLSPLMVSTSPLLGGVLLIAAGIFQWTPLKCLPRALPFAAEFSDDRLARGPARRVCHGPETRRLLHRVLLVSDGAAVCGGCHEHLVGGRHFDSRVARKGRAERAVPGPNRWDRVRGLGSLDHAPLNG